MSESINSSRKKRETVTELTNEAIDKALYHKNVAAQAALPADELLNEWEQEDRLEKEEARLAENENTLGETADEVPALEETSGEKEDEAEAFLRSLGAGEEI